MDPRTFLETVAVKCPAYGEHLPDCALAPLQPGGAISEIRRCIEALDNHATDELVRQHFLCLCRKNGCGID